MLLIRTRRGRLVWCSTEARWERFLQELKLCGGVALSWWLARVQARRRAGHSAVLQLLCELALLPKQAREWRWRLQDMADGLARADGLVVVALQ